MDSVGRSASLLVGRTKEVTVHRIISSRFSIEMEFETSESKGKLWTIFVYVSNKERERMDQWHELWSKKASGVLGGFLVAILMI